MSKELCDETLVRVVPHHSVYAQLQVLGNIAYHGRKYQYVLYAYKALRHANIGVSRVLNVLNERILRSSYLW